MAGARGVVLAPLPQGLSRTAWLFGEDQGRYLIETGEPETVLAAARVAAIPARVIGVVGGVALTLPGAGAISVDALRAANEAWLPAYMAQG
jgi:phosphoribosylformylglycinamidine synthase subunit PurL